MALIENTLFGEIDRVSVAIERIRTFCPPDGLWCAVSGGKDSTVIYDLVHRAGVKASYHHNATTIDPPEVIHHIRKYQPDVEIHVPKIPLLKFMLQKGLPPMRNIRWCCEVYKEAHGEGTIVLGIRAAESTRRAGRRMIQSCMKDKTKTYLSPIIDWSDADVWEYIKSRNLPYLSLYDKGFKRVGCVLCPMSRDVERDRSAFPKLYEAWHRAFLRLYDQENAKGKMGKHADGESFWQWWVSRDAKTSDPDQLTLFEE